MELPSKSTAFQIKPDLENILQSVRVKEIIQTVIQPILNDQTYSSENAKKWTKDISNGITTKLKEEIKKYKIVVQVVITQKQGQGFKFIARARWDSEADRQVSDSFTNDTIICIVTVFGIYLY